MLDDLQFSYRGLVFGAGTDIYVNSAEGFEGFEVRTSDVDLPRGDGAIRGLDYVAPRTIAFELAVVELTGGDTSYETYWARIREAFAPARDTDDVLTFKRPGMPERFVRCRPIQLVRKEEYKRFNAVGFPPVVLRAVDPRIYASDANSVTVPVYTATTGSFELSSDFPLDFFGGQQVEVVAHNNGTAPAYPLVRFYGPQVENEAVYYPDDFSLFPSEDLYPVDPLGDGGTGVGLGSIDGVTLTNTTTGDVLEISTTIVDRQVLIADMTAAVTGDSRLVVSVDDSSRYGAWQLPRAPFALAPGPNVLRFEVVGSSLTAVCHLSWFDTWLD